MTMKGGQVRLARPSASADCGGVRSAQLGKTDITGAHAPVSTANSAKTKAGFELGGRFLQLVVLFLSLLLFPRTPPHTHTTQCSYFTHPTLDT